jgi:hypothetical protein
MNRELFTLFQQDQEDRKPRLHRNISQRDQVRRKRVEELIAAEALQSPEDFFYAAMIFQHGKSTEDYWQAHFLAKKAVALGYRPARWLAAAAYDRWLMGQDKPQKYGTQYIWDGHGSCWRLWDVDPATTDAERAEWDVPSLAQALKRAEETVFGL